MKNYGKVVHNRKTYIGEKMWYDEFNNLLMILGKISDPRGESKKIKAAMPKIKPEYRDYILKTHYER